MLEREAGEIDSVIEGAGRAGIPIAPLLAILEASTGPSAASHIAHAAGRRRGWNYWRDDREQLFFRWLDERAPAKLAQALVGHPDHPDAPGWLDPTAMPC